MGHSPTDTQGPTALSSLEDNRGEVSTDTAARLLDAAPDAMLAIDSAGRVAFANTRAQELFGYELADLIGLEASHLVPSGLGGGGNGNGGGSDGVAGAARELRGRRSDGVEFPAEVSLSPVRQNGGTVTIAAVRDATHRGRIEAELRRTKDRLAEAQRVAGFGSFEWDPASGELSWSDQLFRIYGLEPGSIKPDYEAFLERIHPADREFVSRQIGDALASGESFENLKRGVRPDGAVFVMHTHAEVIVDDDGTVQRIVGICKDVTAETAAKEATARLASIVRSSDDAIITRTLDGTITSWNPARGPPLRLPRGGDSRRQGAAADSARVHQAEQETVNQLVRGEWVEHFETQRISKDGTAARRLAGDVGGSRPATGS